MRTRPTVSVSAPFVNLLEFALTQPFRIYIAAPFQLRDEAQHLMTLLELDGHVVTSQWLRIDDMPDTDASARMDLEDIDRADALLLLNPAEWRTDGTGGRHVEFGYAYAKGKTLFVVGARTNVFHYLEPVHLTTEPALVVPALRMHLLVKHAKVTH